MSKAKEKNIVVVNSKGGVGKTMFVMAIADVLKDVQIIDLDPQKTITYCSGYTGRHTPINEVDRSAKYLLYDTPPYNDITLKNVLKTASLIIIPTKLSQSDLLATQAILKQIRILKKEDISYIVFNEVRNPPTIAQKKVEGYFNKNYQDFKKAKTKLSTLTAFRDIMETPLKPTGKAYFQIKSLLKEVGII